MKHAFVVRFLLVSLVALALLAPVSAQETNVREGVVEQVSSVEIGKRHHHGVAAIIGAGVGYGVGSLIGGGHGRDLARVAGELAGSTAAVHEARQSDQPVQGEQIVVRLTNGVLVAITQSGGSELHVGQPVLIEGAGEHARVVAR